MKLTDKDRELLKEKGISEDRLSEQLRQFAEGFPWLEVVAPATIGCGIKSAGSEIAKDAASVWDRFVESGGKVVKMVPASGAASRMFKNVFAFADGNDPEPKDDFMKKFFNEIEKFAFFRRLNLAVVTLEGENIDTMLKKGRYRDVAKYLLGKDGLNYGKLPKGMLLFHKVPGSARTPIEEHMSEGAQYAACKDGKVHIHFTVSEEHMPLMQRKVEEVKAFMAHDYDTDFDITFSVQKPSTDTVAVDMDNQPYRENDCLVFRPGGHGALIENLNDIDADVVFIKNIDNVVPDSLKKSTVEYKKIIGGILVAMKTRADHYCHKLHRHDYSDADLEEMLTFLRDVLCITGDDADNMDRKEKAAYLLSKLNRPMRVCGMVKNEGEPGGGPFLVRGADGTISPQILESTQIDPSNPEAMSQLADSTHFNPVDLVCAVKDYKGKKFNLLDYVDKATGFISIKSKNGVEVKALELPGLWNGAMADWNTIFVEVPADTFNPVKTVNDLLRVSHQG